MDPAPPPQEGSGGGEVAQRRKDWVWGACGGGGCLGDWVNMGRLLGNEEGEWVIMRGFIGE